VKPEDCAKQTFSVSSIHWWEWWTHCQAPDKIYQQICFYF
jgi:hypothetical protein